MGNMLHEKFINWISLNKMQSSLLYKLTAHDCFDYRDLNILFTLFMVLTVTSVIHVLAIFGAECGNCWNEHNLIDTLVSTYCR